MPSTTTASSGHTSGRSGRQKGRRTRLLVLVLVLAIVGGVGYGAYWSVSTVRASFPQTKGSVKLRGLSGPVDVKRDAYGIPQIYASSAEDLFMAQGYVQAQDRFWEMDVRRHTTSGRLSEMFGKSQVKTDAYLRTLGWNRVARQEYDTKLSPRTKTYLQAYAKGVNAYLAGKGASDMSVEYAALGLSTGYKPQKWSPVDSVAWLKALAWDLRGNMQDEIDRSLMTSRLQPAQIRDLYPDYPYDLHKPIVQEGSYDAAKDTFDGARSGSGAPHTSGTEMTGDQAARAAGTGLADGVTAPDSMQSQLAAVSDVLDGIPSVFGPSGSGIGSNSWVVSGAHTITGKPLLANDPHLAPELPSIWYQMGLHCRALSDSCPYDVSGYTFSGMPGVIIGHNPDIAWGMTNLGADVTDLYLEKLSGDGYQYGGRVVPFRTRKETIKVAGGPSKTITVRETDNPFPSDPSVHDHCPLLSDRDDELVTVGKKATVNAAAPDRGDGYGVALCWTALTPGKTMDAVFELDRAQDWQQFRAAAGHLEVPSQNLVYADTKGNIGYQAPGRIPLRPKGDDGSLPAPGWDPAFHWTGQYIKQSAMPYEYNPKRGYIVTANQAVVDRKAYPYTLTTDWEYGTRSQRITDLIQAKTRNGGKISPDDMRQMQMDNSSEIARLLVPRLLKIDVRDPHVREAQKLLEGWDYTQNADSAAAAYFNAVWRNILKLAFGNKLPKELRVEGQCLNVEPADAIAPADEEHTLVRECGKRDPDSAQPDGGDRWFEVVRRIIDDQGNAWWHAPRTRTEPAATTRDQLFARALDDARWELTAKLGKDIDTWSWGRLHRLILKNQTLGTSGPGVLQYLLNRGPWNMAGGEAAVDATGWNAAGGYSVIWVPSMRMVVNLQDFDKSKWINLTGASGHAFDAHYTDQTAKWVNGDLLTWSYSPKAVDESTEATLALRP